VERVASVLLTRPLTKCTEVVAEMDITGGLHARQHAGRFRHDPGRYPRHDPGSPEIPDSRAGAR
jgi:hypothetical protein